jgi:hypothetical protein
VFIQCKGAIDVKERARTSIGSSRNDPCRASGSSIWLERGLERQKSSTDRFHVLFSTGWQGFIAIEAVVGERKDRHGDGGHIGDMAKFCLLSKKEQ